MNPLQTTELRLIGACLQDIGACATAIELLKPEMFSDDKHQKVFAQIVTLFSDGNPINLVTVSQVLPEMAFLLTEAMTSVSDTTNVEYHARIVQQEYLRRTAAHLGDQLSRALKGGEDVFDAIDSHTKKLSDATVFGRVDTHIRYGIDGALGRLTEWEAGSRTDVIPTGFYSLDQIIGGFTVAELAVIGSPTGAGKTSIMIHMALAYARRCIHKHDLPPALIFSAEMNREQLIHRAASNEARVNLSEIKSNSAQSDLVKDFRDAITNLSSLPIHIDDTPDPTLDQIMAVARRVQAEEGLGAIYVDYDERIVAAGESEELRVGAVAKGLKRIAKVLSVPVICISQYSREAKNPKWPDDSWLRYSGKKEQEAALILHWYWPHFWTKKGYPADKIPRYQSEKHGYLIVSKNRFGNTGYVDLMFEPSQARFSDPREPSEFPTNGQFTEREVEASF